MMDILKSFKSLIKLEQVHTDNNVFKLHYKVTVIMLLGFSILLTSKQYFGDPIICDVKEDKDVINTYCWITGTFIIADTLPDRKGIPGLGNAAEYYSPTINRQGYYQWVCIVFCLQALIFYFPRYLWKTWEGGRLRLLLTDITGPLPSPKWNTATKDKIVQYLLSGRCAHNIYMIRYCFCEILNFVNVVAQIFLMDWFMTGNFSIYGIAYVSYDLINPMDKTFPKVTKCTYYKYGPSGTRQEYDALCILPLNVLNAKCFLILWYWLLLLLLISFCALIYRGLFLFVPKFRVYLLRAQTRNIETKRAESIIEHVTYGDFFVLYKVGKNMNPIMYRELVDAIDGYIMAKGLKAFKKYPQGTDEV